MPYIEYPKTVPLAPKPANFFSMNIPSTQVCNKPNCMSYGSIGSIRNGRAKIRKT